MGKLKRDRVSRPKLDVDAVVYRNNENMVKLLKKVQGEIETVFLVGGSSASPNEILSPEVIASFREVLSEYKFIDYSDHDGMKALIQNVMNRLRKYLTIPPETSSESEFFDEEIEPCLPYKKGQPAQNTQTFQAVEFDDEEDFDLFYGVDENDPVELLKNTTVLKVCETKDRVNKGYDDVTYNRSSFFHTPPSTSADSNFDIVLSTSDEDDSPRPVWKYKRLKAYGGTICTISEEHLLKKKKPIKDPALIKDIVDDYIRKMPDLGLLMSDGTPEVFKVNLIANLFLRECLEMYEEEEKDDPTATVISKKMEVKCEKAEATIKKIRQLAFQKLIYNPLKIKAKEFSLMKQQLRGRISFEKEKIKQGGEKKKKKVKSNANEDKTKIFSPVPSERTTKKTVNTSGKTPAPMSRRKIVEAAMARRRELDVKKTEKIVSRKAVVHIDYDVALLEELMEQYYQYKKERKLRMAKEIEEARKEMQRLENLDDDEKFISTKKNLSKKKGKMKKATIISETSINPSYTNLKPSYHSICQERIRRNMKLYRDLLAKEMDGFVDRAVYAIEGVRMARCYVQGCGAAPAVPMKPREIKRIQDLMS